MNSLVRLTSLAIAAGLITAATTLAADPAWVEYAGELGPGRGKHVVFLSGDEEYRSEEGLPMLAKILSQRHGFKCTVLFPVDPDTGEIDPKINASLPGAEALDSADAIVMLTRFRAWPDEAMEHFVKAFEAGKPIIALRTSTHAFNFPEGRPYREYNDFGKRVLGENWVSHWGRHKEEATRGVVEPAAANSPLLRGVEQVFGDSDVYEAYPPADSTVLLRGEVLDGMTSDSAPAEYEKKRASDGGQQDVNDPMMPIAWTRTHKHDSGAENRIFCTTMGAATDLQSEGLRRLIVNAVYWGLEMDSPAKTDVRYVGEFKPTAYGFDGFQKGLKPAAFALPRAPDADQTRAEDLLKLPPRPARAGLPPSVLPLEFLPGERIALVGNSTAERMNLFGHFEALLHSRFADRELKFRNFARPADAVNDRQRPSSYTFLDDPMRAFGPDTLLCFFGFNESFDGEAGVEKFRADYNKLLEEIAAQYPRDDEGSPPRLVLVSPIAWEATGNPLWPEAEPRNRELKRYAQVVADVAREHGLAFVDLFTPTEKLYAAEPGMQFTINGCHVNEAGDRAVALALHDALFGPGSEESVQAEGFGPLRAAVNDKSWIHSQDYRMINGWYVYGGRRTWDTETFPREYLKIRAMTDVRDRYVWDLAQGKSPGPPDDSHTGELYVPETRFGNPGQDYSEPEALKYLTPEECIATMKVPDGFEVKLFASEREFPELAKPCQLSFDNRGRLWVACMPTYPQWKPGDPKPSDRLLILEDTDGDGKADKSTVFYDKLTCPTGFEFYNGGVIVTDQPRLVWLKDHDGDDRADEIVHLLDGWATDDTHHTVGAFEYSHGGLLHMLEGVAMSTTVETPWGPHRRKGASGAHVLNPRTLQLTHFETPGYGNPWCYVFTPWGQGIVGDGTGAAQHWDSPLSGAAVTGRRGMDAVFDTQGMRPVVGSEFLLSRHLPDDVQGQFIYACVINMNGLTRFNVRDAENGAGFVGERAIVAGSGEAQVDNEGRRRRRRRASQGTPDDLLVSTDKNFRPVDPQIGPDGAIWFGDWCNALIGHMQYSQRDPNRDHHYGRIYRMVAKGRPLLAPVTQYGRSELELLEQFREYEPRTRYRARRELNDRPTDVVKAAIGEWLKGLDENDPEFDRLRCEAMWVLQRHDAVDVELVKQLLKAKSSDARAAAVHAVADERTRLPEAYELIAEMVNDEHPRVRLEAIRGLSFYPTMDSVGVALASLKSPQDSWLAYTLEHTIGALEPAWRDAYQSGKLATDDPGAYEYINNYVSRQAPGLAAQTHLAIALNPDSGDHVRDRSFTALERLRGNAENGKAVFKRVCATCHKVGDEGYDFGPNQSDVGKRLTRAEVIESIIEPSKKVDEKYVTTSVLTMEGKAEVGFVIEQSDESITLLMAEGKQQTFARDDIDEMFEMNQSSMPENLAATMAPAEFLDVVEYLMTLRESPVQQGSE
jgi:putative membrane-bound dehydrogenase-like protein